MSPLRAVLLAVAFAIGHDLSPADWLEMLSDPAAVDWIATLWGE